MVERNRNSLLGFLPLNEDKITLLINRVDSKDELSLEILRQIKYYLGRSLLTSSLDEKTPFWIERLHRYVNAFGFKFSKDDHIAFVKILFNIVSIEGLDYPILIASMQLLHSALLRKPRFLAPNELTLDWRVLYELYKRTFIKPPTKEESFAHLQLHNDVKNLILVCKPYFAPCATQEIFDEEKVKLYPLYTKYKRQFQYLSWFLPTTTPIGHTPPHDVWLPKLMTLWKACYFCDFESHLMELLSQYAKNHIGCVDWEPHITFIYTRILASFKFPIEFKGSNPISTTAGVDMTSASLWIVSTLGGGSVGQNHLSKFIECLAPYYHSVNHGKWTPSLLIFYQNLVKSFAFRLKGEKKVKLKWAINTPESHKLTEADIDEFFNCMFRQPFLDSHSLSESFQILAALRPQVAIPTFIKQYDESFGDICKPLKNSIALYNLITLSTVLVNSREYNYSLGATHVIPTLLKITSNMEVNVWGKVFIALKALSSFLSKLPIADSSAFPHPETLTEEESTINTDTQHFEEIIFMLLDTIFGLINNCSYLQTRLDSETKEMTNFDTLILDNINSLSSAVFPNLSKEIFDKCLNKLKNFIFSDVLETKVAGKFIAHIAKKFCQANPKVVMGKLFPALCESVISSISEDDAKEDESKDAVLYYLCILSEILNCQREGLMEFAQEIESILGSAIKLNFRSGFVFTSDAIRNLLATLVSQGYKIDNRWSYSTTVYDQLPIKDWGLKRTLGNVNLIHSHPGPLEVEFIQSSIINKIIWPSVEYVNRFSESDMHCSRVELEKHLTIISSLTTINDVLPAIDERPLYENDLVEFSHMQTSFVPKLSIVTPAGGNLKKYLLSLMVSLHTKLSNCDEDNTAAFELIIKIFSGLLVTRYDSLAMEKIKTKALDIEYKNPIALTTDLPIPYLNEKLTIAANKLKFPEVYKLTETISASIETLLKLCLSCYPMVGGDARTVINHILKRCPESIKLIIPFVESQLLKKHDQSTPEYKGLINMLASYNGTLFKHKDVVTKSNIWPNILSVDIPEEKISILIFSNLEKSIGENYFFYHWIYQIPEELINAGHLLWNSSVKPFSNPPSSNEIVAGREKLSEDNAILKNNYYTLIKRILQHDNLHWKFEVLRLNLLRRLAVRNFDYPPSVLQLLLGKLLDLSLNIRTEAILCIGPLLKQLERNKGAKLDTREYLNTNIDVEAWSFRENATNDLVQYNKDKQDTTIVHNEYEGYFCWSRTIDNPLRADTPNSTIVNFFNRENVAKFYSLFCCHTPGEKSLSIQDVYFLKHLFINARPVIKLFVNEVSASGNEHRFQFFTAEIICGALKAVKYWDKDKQEEVWSSVMPVIKNCLEKSEMFTFWEQCFVLIAHNRDPNSLKALYEYVSDWDLEDTELLTVVHRKIKILRSIVYPVCWKFTSSNKDLLAKILPLLDHPYQSHRSNMSELLFAIFIGDVSFDGTRSASAPLAGVFLNEIILPMFSILEEPLTGVSHDAASYKKSKLTFKTVCNWVVLVGLSGQSVWPEAYQLIPALCQIGKEDPNSETALLCKNMLRVLATNHLNENYFRQIFDNFCTFFEKTTFTNFAKISLLQFTQGFVFINITYLFNDTTRLNKINDIVLNLLNDPNLEVKQAAKAVLRDFIKCKIASDLHILKDRFTEGCQNPLDKNSAAAISLRQGNILGLLALVAACPYEIPDHIIQIFETLSNHLNDPHPIPTWIANAVDSFRHTQPDKLLLAEKIPNELLQILSSSKLSYFS